MKRVQIGVHFWFVERVRQSQFWTHELEYSADVVLKAYFIHRLYSNQLGTLVLFDIPFQDQPIGRKIELGLQEDYWGAGVSQKYRWALQI
jgi:hypothetical protein